MVSRVQLPGLAYSVADVMGLDDLSVMWTVSPGTSEPDGEGIVGVRFGAWAVEGELVPLLFGSWGADGLAFEPEEESWSG